MTSITAGRGCRLLCWSGEQTFLVTLSSRAAVAAVAGGSDTLFSGQCACACLEVIYASN